MNTFFKGKIFYSPGYEESNKKRSNYKKNIGYFNKLIDEKDGGILSILSNNIFIDCTIVIINETARKNNLILSHNTPLTIWYLRQN